MFHFGENVLSSWEALRLSGSRRVSTKQPLSFNYPGRPGVTQPVQLWPSWIRECKEGGREASLRPGSLMSLVEQAVGRFTRRILCVLEMAPSEINKGYVFPKCFFFFFAFLALICNYPFLKGHDRKPKIVAFTGLHLCNFKLLPLLYSCKSIFNSQYRLWLFLKSVCYVKWACFRFSVILVLGHLHRDGVVRCWAWAVVIYSTLEYVSHYASFWIFATSCEYCKFQILFVVSQGAKLWHILSFNPLSRWRMVNSKSCTNGMHIFGISGYSAYVLWGGQKPASKESSDIFRNEDKGRIYLYDLYITFAGKKGTQSSALTLRNSTWIVMLIFQHENSFFVILSGLSLHMTVYC